MGDLAVNIHSLDLVVIGVYVAATLAVGFTVGRRVQTARDFFLAGKALTWPIVGLSIIGTNLGAVGFIGASGGAYSVGIVQANFEWIGAIPAMVLACFIFIPLYWRAGVYSIPEYLGLRYGQTVRLLAASVMVLFMVVYVGVALWSIALMLQTYMGIPIWMGVAVMALIVGAYSTLGGLSAVAFTDALQVLIMFLSGVSLVVIGFVAVGGVDEFVQVIRTNHPSHLDVYLPADHSSFPWPGVIFGLGLVLSPAFWIGNQAILQRTLGAKSEWDASAGMMLAAFAKLFVPLLLVFPGLLALAIGANIDVPDQALPWIVKNMLPTGLSGLMFIAIVAALQSTIDSSLNAVSLMVTRDIRGFIKSHRNPKTDLIWGRAVSLVALISGIALVPLVSRMGGIWTFIQTVLALFQGPMLALLIFAAFMRRTSYLGGVITLLGGWGLAIVLQVFDFNLFDTAFFSFVFAICLLVTTSFFGFKSEQRPDLTYFGGSS
jgi:SSS family solute:Na+ symporter